VDRAQLRREMRARRRRLSVAEQTAATSAIARVVARSRLLRPGRRVAVYFKQGSEADLAAVIALARRARCVLYLPVITQRRHSRMEFMRFDARTSLRANSFGILEPHGDERIPVRRLDLVLMPLVAVDERGWRLGSGAGFYDRRLQHLRAGRQWRRPKLIGIAYEFQRVPRLEAQPWDVPLDAVITERRMHRIPTQRGIP
jgi:5-formyltetrahydrofolate cyclo-ligase